MKLLAILVLGGGLVWWFLLRPAPESSTAPSPQAHSSSQAAGSETSNPLKRPLDKAREAMEAKKKQSEGEF